jgi:hypothetical protein
LILLYLEKVGWEDSSLPLNAWGMTPMKVRFFNLIIDEEKYWVTFIGVLQMPFWNHFS